MDYIDKLVQDAFAAFEDANPSTLTNLDLEHLTPEQALQLAIGATAGAQYKIELGKYKHAAVMQKQAELWFDLHDELKPDEDAPRPSISAESLAQELIRVKTHLAQMAGARNTLKDMVDELESALEDAKQSRDSAVERADRLTSENAKLRSGNAI